MCIESCFSNLNTGIVNYSNKPEVKYLDIDTMYLSYTGTETDVVIAHQARNTTDYTSDLVAKLKGFIPMGVEIEVEHTPDNDNGWDRDESTEEALLEMHSYTHYIDDTDSRLRQLVIAKVDGSLDHGVEFVTQPMTLRAHTKLIMMHYKVKGSMLGMQVQQDCMYMYPSHGSLQLNSGYI